MPASPPASRPFSFATTRLRRVVVKLGTGVLTAGAGLRPPPADALARAEGQAMAINETRIAAICAQIAELRRQGTEVIVTFPMEETGAPP